MTGADLRSRLLDRLAGLAERVLGPSPEVAEHIFAGLTAGERRRALAFVAAIRGSRGKRTLEAAHWAAEVAPWLRFAEVVVEHEVALMNAALVIQAIAPDQEDAETREAMAQTGQALDVLLGASFALAGRAKALPHLRASLDALAEGRPPV